MFIFTSGTGGIIPGLARGAQRSPDVDAAMAANDEAQAAHAAAMAALATTPEMKDISLPDGTTTTGVNPDRATAQAKVDETQARCDQTALDLTTKIRDTSKQISLSEGLEQAGTKVAAAEKDDTTKF